MFFAMKKPLKINRKELEMIKTVTYFPNDNLKTKNISTNSVKRHRPMQVILLNDIKGINILKA